MFGFMFMHFYVSLTIVSMFAITKVMFGFVFVFIFIADYFQKFVLC